MSTPDPDLHVTLHGPPPASSVDVRLRRVGERWVAQVAGVHVAVGASARAALMAAIRPLGEAASRALLADLALLEPSLAIARDEAETA
jgi:hypothetical protein